MRKELKRRAKRTRYITQQHGERPQDANAKILKLKNKCSQDKKLGEISDVL